MRAKAAFPLVPILALFLIGCASLERNAYRTIGTLAVSVEAARQAFVDYENTGKVTQQTHDQVQAIYVEYQKAMASAQELVTIYKTSPNPDDTALQTALTKAMDAATAIINAIQKFLPPERAADVAKKTGVKPK